MSLPDSVTLSRAINRSLTIDVRGRRSERRFGGLALLALPLAVSLLSLHWLAAALVSMSIAGLVMAGLWWHGWLGGARRLTAVSWLADGGWLLTDGAQANVPATLSPHTRVGSRWLWLRWHVAAGVPGLRSRSMLLVQGDLPGRELRQLGVRLRLESVCRQPSHARALVA